MTMMMFIRMRKVVLIRCETGTKGLKVTMNGLNETTTQNTTGFGDY